MLFGEYLDLTVSRCAAYPHRRSFHRDRHDRLTGSATDVRGFLALCFTFITELSSQQRIYMLAKYHQSYYTRYSCDLSFELNLTLSTFSKTHCLLGTAPQLSIPPEE